MGKTKTHTRTAAIRIKNKKQTATVNWNNIAMHKLKREWKFEIKYSALSPGNVI